MNYKIKNVIINIRICIKVNILVLIVLIVHHLNYTMVKVRNICNSITNNKFNSISNNLNIKSQYYRYKIVIYLQSFNLLQLKKQQYIQSSNLQIHHSVPYVRQHVNQIA